MARGSLSETMDHIIIALDEKIIDQQTYNNFQTEYEQCLKLLNGYIQYLKSKKTEV